MVLMCRTKSVHWLKKKKKRHLKAKSGAGLAFPALKSFFGFFFCQKMTWCLRMKWGRTLLHSSPYSDNSSAITFQGCIKMKLAAGWEIPSPPAFPTYSLRRLNRWWVEEFGRAALWRNTECLFQCAHSPSVCGHLPVQGRFLFTCYHENKVQKQGHAGSKLRLKLTSIDQDVPQVQVHPSH